jgi:mannan endo-1,4-beta-mannosidase
VARLFVRLICAAVVAGVVAIPCMAQAGFVPDDIDGRGGHFIRRSGGALFHHGRPFRVAGTSNYCPMYVSPGMVDDFLGTAAVADFNVVRFWGALDIGGQDGSNSIDGKHNGVYFHYFDGSTPAFNDGDDGLKHQSSSQNEQSNCTISATLPHAGSKGSLRARQE